MDDVLYVPVAVRSAHGRGAERRRGASALLQSVISALSVASGPAAVRERFEQELRSMVRARAVAVCEGSSAQQPAGNVMVFDIPSVVLAQCARIEIVFDPGRTLDGWTCELLEAATHVAALVLEIERALGRPPQFARIRRDGAAPLIGSSRAIRQVRERIERVAVTDFTILMEGGIGPQPHLSFIEVFELSCRPLRREGGGGSRGGWSERARLRARTQSGFRVSVEADMRRTRNTNATDPIKMRSPSWT
jgi:hypothetical protein